MIEDVEEVFHHIVLLAGAGEKELGVGRRHDGDGGTEAHELDSHCGLAVVEVGESEDFAGRKRKRSARGEADGFALGRHEIADGLELRLHLLQQAHSLEEVHAKGLVFEHFANS